MTCTSPTLYLKNCSPCKYQKVLLQIPPEVHFVVNENKIARPFQGLALLFFHKDWKFSSIAGVELPSAHIHSPLIHVAWSIFGKSVVQSTTRIPRL